MNILKRLLITFLVLVGIGVLVTGCALPKHLVTDQRISELRKALVGRQFVFSTDWYNYHRIYKNKPTHHCETTPAKQPECSIGDKLFAKHRLLARAGTLAHITNVHLSSTMWVFIDYRTQDNNPGRIVIVSDSLGGLQGMMGGTGGHAKWTDETATISAIENQLTYATIQFTEPAREARPQPTRRPKPIPLPRNTHPQTSEERGAARDGHKPETVPKKTYRAVDELGDLDDLDDF